MNKLKKLSDKIFKTTEKNDKMMRGKKEKHKKEIHKKEKSRMGNMLSIASLLVFGVSLLPLLYMCRYVHASGDDYGYGALTHAA